VLKARRCGYAIALEDLEKLRDSFNNNCSKVAWKFTLFAYRELREAVVSKAIEFNIPVVFVDPRNTSSTCPRCGSKIKYVGRLGACRRCNFKADRDVIGAVNVWLRVLEGCAGERGSPPRAPAVKNEARQSEGRKDEGMKQVVRCI